jgi:hypothetical protein
MLRESKILSNIIFCQKIMEGVGKTEAAEDLKTKYHPYLTKKLNVQYFAYFKFSAIKAFSSQKSPEMAYFFRSAFKNEQNQTNHTHTY